MTVFNQAVTVIMAVFFLLGTADRLFGNHLGLGTQYEKGFHMMGQVALVIIGLYCIAPVLGTVLAPVVTPFYHLIGSDPAMFGPTIFTIDAGGYSLAMEMCDDPAIGKFAGVVVSTLTGAAISYTIPFAIVSLNTGDFRKFSIGIMAGIAGGPFGAFVAGLVYGLSPLVLIKNLSSVIVVALLIIFGLLFTPKVAIVVFKVIAKIIAAIIAVGLGAAGFEAVTGYVLIPGMNPLSDGAALVGKIIVIVSGSLCLLYTLQKFCARPISFVSRKLKVNSFTTLNFLASLAITAAIFPDFSKMDTKGKILVSASAATIANIFGGHLGYTATVAKDMILIMFIGKLVAGAVAIALALVFASRLYPGENAETCPAEIAEDTVAATSKN